jgi:hypothetical protein
MAIRRVDHRNVLGICSKQCLLLISAAITLAIAYAPATQAQIFFGSPISLTTLTNGGSILVGDKLFSNFAVSDDSAASNIFVQGIEEFGDDFGIQFQGGFVATDNSDMDVHLSYQVNVTNSTDLIAGANLSFNGVVVGGAGLAQVTETIDTNTDFPYGQMVVSTTQSMQQLTTNMVINPPQSQLNVDKDVINFAVHLAFSSISTINQSFEQVPEPSTVTLAVVGFTGLLLLRRRRH